MKDSEAFWIFDGNVKTTYRSVRELLRKHPDLEPLWEALRAAPLSHDYDEVKHARAKKAWNDALDKRRIRLVFVDTSVGFGSDKELPDPYTHSEPGGRAI